MLCLPAISFGGGDWRLPLAPASAAALMENLLSDSAEDQSVRWAQAIKRDAGLALWSFCRASLAGARQVNSAAALAAWLAESPLDLLDGLQAEYGADETPHSILIRAADAWRAAGNCTPALPGWLQQAIAAYCEQRCASAELLNAERVLPALVENLARLRQLESFFQERLEAEKLEAMAEFAAGAGHEINNPIAVIAGRAQLFLRQERDSERRRELAVMNSQAMRVYEMISDMMLFARPPKPKLAECDVSQLLDKLLGELQLKAAECKVELIREGVCDPFVIRADQDQVGVAIRVLIENALEATPDGGRVQVGWRDARSTDCAAQQPGDEIEIVVRDNGPGISPKIRRHLFDPFFSGRGAGRGIGLGLSKCWRIVTNHGGRIEVECEADRGSTFTVHLPVAARVDATQG